MNKIKNVGNYTISVLTYFHWTKIQWKSMETKSVWL